MKRMLALVLLLAGCGTSATAGPGSPWSPGGTVTVFAAASLTESFTELGHRFEQSHPGTHVRFSFAGSQTLVAQVQQGAPADVVATADTQSGDQVAAELAGPARTFARNGLAIIYAHGDPLGLHTLADLARPGLKVVLAADSVPAGRAAREALVTAGVQVAPVSQEKDVKAVVQRVRLGEADAGIAYRTDLATAPDLSGTALPGVTNSYPVGVLQAAPDVAGGRAFVDYLLSADGQAVLRRYGFVAPA